ncbi:MAG: ATP-binding cassette subfamily F protein 3 [Verrucomicrobiales bacterium]|jgi:ATP-binding cassette subfamily F protein 3
MLTLNKVEKGFNGRTLFSDVSLQVNMGDRAGLVGPNGAGKTTLFSLILGEDSPDDGTISRDKRTTLGYLPQESAPVGDETVLEVATSVSAEIVGLRAKLAAAETSGDLSSGDFADAQSRFDELGGYHLEPKAKRILKGLAFGDDEFDRPMKELSGGWVMRAHLARLLVQEPDLLMLDEPTNHLDLESLRWFQGYLKGYPGAILMISHDREFLNELCDSMVHIFRGQLHHYRGNYDTFLVKKKDREEQQWAAYKNQQREISKLEDFVRRFRAKASKAAQAQSKLTQLNKIVRLAPPANEEATVSIKMPQPKRKSGRKVIELIGVHQAYGETKVYTDLNFEAERKERIVLVGPNGSGKSTLLKLLAGDIDYQQGERKPGLNVDVGYFAQYRTRMLDIKHSVLEEALDTQDRTATEQEVRTLLGCFLFSGDDAYKSVSVLSGGEKSRLALVKILLNPPNLLLMDEPTTHLDMTSIDALTNALKQFEGTLVFISHDVYFIRSIAETVLHIDSGKITRYHGDYDYYLEKSGADSERAALTAGQPKQATAAKSKPAAAGSGSGPKTKEQKRKEAQERQEKAKSRKAAESKLAKAEARVETLEARQKEINAILNDSDLYQTDPNAAVKLNRELSELEEKLIRANCEWDELAEKVGAE